MITQKHSNKSACLAPHEIEKRLEEAGIQPTAQRIAICRYVLCEADHPSAEDVKEWADRNFPKMSLATVYNTLGTLAKSGILREFRFPHSDKVIYDNNVEPHYHFLDEKTGKLYDIMPHELEVKPNQQFSKDFQVKEVEVVLRGSKR